jgi:hypothetical protein
MLAMEANVRFGSLADMAASISDVRLPSECVAKLFSRPE